MPIAWSGPLMAIAGAVLLLISILNTKTGFLNAIIFGIIPMVLGFVLLAAGLYSLRFL